MGYGSPALITEHAAHESMSPQAGMSVRIREAKQMATRRMSNEERAIVDAVDALKAPLHPCPHTDGIGPTHSDITADCVAKAFGVPIDSDPRALAILHEWVKTTGAEMNEARLRLTRIPKGADLILNKVSGAPGFWIGNVIVMAGVPSIMQAMPDEVAPKLKIGVSTARAQHECGAARPRCTQARAGQTRGRGHAGASAADTIE